MAKSFEIESKEFLSCEISFFTRKLHVTFDCAAIDETTTHKNHLNRVKNDTCDTKDFTAAFSITLKNCRLPSTPNAFLQRLEHVQQINLDTAGIKAIDNGTFPDSCSLEELSLSNNYLTKLPGFMFSSMPNISEVNLSGNRISSIDPYTFRGPTNMLTKINLSHNQIDTITRLLFTDLINLEELNLGFNFIEYFHIDLTNLKELTLLQLDNNQITQLDCTIFDLTTNKIDINVNLNHIREIDLNCDSRLESLRLNIDDNQLTNLTFTKSNLLNSLTEMHASRNLIESITFPQTFRQLTQLHLNINNLKEFVEFEETMFPKLKYLDITGNQFNCSYLNIFLRNIPKALILQGMPINYYLDLEPELLLKTSERSKTSKMIHGIDCNDDMKSSDHTDDVSHTHTVMWCLLAFLSFTVGAFLIVKIIKCYREYHRKRTEPKLDFYLVNQQNSTE